MAPMRAPLPRLRSRPDVQGLRAVAVGLVILDHAGVPGVRGGFVGVDVFFVVSGFLISSLLLHEATTTGRVRIGSFYARRARRILPAASVVLMATVAFAALELSVVRVQEIVQDVRWAAFFAANVHFSRLGTDYFEQDRADSPVQHFWSLAVEEQFYLFWPVLLLVCMLVARRRLALVTALVVGAWVSSLVWSMLLTASAPTQAYFSSATRVWELATGALLALAGHALVRLPLAARHLLSVCGLAAIATAAVAFDASTPFPGWRAVLPVLGTAAVLAAGAAGVVGAGRLLTPRPVRYVGDISYSLYLWHWPVFVLGAEYVGRSRSPLETWLMFGLTAVLSMASYHLVESPFRRARGPILRGRRALALWPAALAMVLFATVWAGAHATSAFEARVAGPPQAQPPDPFAVAREVEVQERPIRERLAASLRLVDAKAPIPFPLENFDGLRQDAWHFEFPCYSTGDTSRHEVCPLGDPRARRTVVVYGDSHAGMWLPALRELAEQGGYRVVPLIKIGCGPFDVEQKVRGSSFPYCSAFRDWAVRRIEKLRPDTIVLAYRGLLQVQPQPGQSKPDAWADGVFSSVRRLVRLAPTVKVLSDVTSRDFGPGDCLSDPDSSMAACTSREQAWILKANRFTRRTVEPLGAEFLDITGLVCLGHRCPLVVDRFVTYRDASHVSVSWATRLAPDFEHVVNLAER
jgi:peptidoglycan/LPS O-acetylase OafA/YrhL